MARDWSKEPLISERIGPVPPRPVRPARPDGPEGSGPVLPSVATTVWITCLFGVFGIFPMVLHMSEARRVGADTSRYAIAFGASLVAGVVLWAAVLQAVLH